jgi:hypothetical protein
MKGFIIFTLTKVFPEKLTVVQEVKFPYIYET